MFESFFVGLGVGGFVHLVCLQTQFAQHGTFLCDDAEDSPDIRYCLFLLFLLFSSHGRNVGLSNDEWLCQTNFVDTPERREGK